jgi:hypothetical protein
MEGDASCFLDRIRKYRNSLENKSCGDQDDLQRQRRERERKMESLLDALTPTEDPDTRLRLTRRLEELSEESSRIEHRICRRESGFAGERVSGEALAERYRDFGGVLELLTISEKRSVLAELITGCQWDGEVLEVRL